MARTRTLAALAVTLTVSLAQAAQAAIISPQNGARYVIEPGDAHTTVPLDWSYPLPDPRCTDDYAGVTHYQWTPGLGKGTNGGGTHEGPFSEATLDFAITGRYTSQTVWSCTIDAPPEDHPAGDYNVFDQPLDTITYSVQRYGKKVPKKIMPEPPVLLSYRESLLKLCGPGDCYAKGKAFLEGLDRVINTVTGNGSRSASTASESKWVNIGSASFSFAGADNATVRIPLKRAARKALKERGSLKVRVTVEAKREGRRRNAQRKLTLELPSE